MCSFVIFILPGFWMSTFSHGASRKYCICEATEYLQNARVKPSNISKGKFFWSTWLLICLVSVNKQITNWYIQIVNFFNTWPFDKCALHVHKQIKWVDASFDVIHSLYLRKKNITVCRSMLKAHIYQKIPKKQNKTKQNKTKTLS